MDSYAQRTTHFFSFGRPISSLLIIIYDWPAKEKRMCGQNLSSYNFLFFFLFTDWPISSFIFYVSLGPVCEWKRLKEIRRELRFYCRFAPHIAGGFPRVRTNGWPRKTVASSHSRYADHQSYKYLSRTAGAVLDVNGGTPQRLAHSKFLHSLCSSDVVGLIFEASPFWTSRNKFLFSLFSVLHLHISWDGPSKKRK